MTDVVQFDFEGLTECRLPGKARHGGYVYLVEFVGGIVKVGMTANPQSRLANYTSGAGVFGPQPLRGWLSPLHLNPRATEKILREVLADLGSPVAGREWFTEVSFEEAINKASLLTLQPVDVEFETARAIRGGDDAVRMLASLGGGVEQHLLLSPGRDERSPSGNSVEAVAYMLAAVDGMHGLPQGSEPEVRHFAAARAVLGLLDGRPLVVSA
jgi:hypothetical protein